jgi:CBS domain-containing membrane protein
VKFIQTLKRLVPGLGPVSPAERLRACCGALVGILVTGLISRLALGDAGALPLLIAPMGASAVLLFAVPASPLAQPWSILGGNTISALVGVACAQAIPDPVTAAAVAGAAAIGIMMLTRCLHPPGGAVALTAVLGGPAIQAAGFGFALWPVGLNSLLLLVAALFFNNVTGRRYPHLAPAQPAGGASRIGFAQADLDAVLASYDQVLDVSRDDLDDLLHQVELRALERQAGGVTCGAVMARDIAAVPADMPLAAAWAALNDRRIKALPVAGADGRVIGLATRSDFIKATGWGNVGPKGLRRLWQRLPGGAQTVGQIMVAPVHCAAPETRLAALVPAMTEAGLRHVPIVDRDDRLIGLVTQTDLLAGLFGERMARPELRKAG